MEGLQTAFFIGCTQYCETVWIGFESGFHTLSYVFMFNHVQICFIPTKPIPNPKPFFGFKSAATWSSDPTGRAGYPFESDVRLSGRRWRPGWPRWGTFGEGHLRRQRSDMGESQPSKWCRHWHRHHAERWDSQSAKIDVWTLCQTIRCSGRASETNIVHSTAGHSSLAEMYGSEEKLEKTHIKSHASLQWSLYVLYQWSWESGESTAEEAKSPVFCPGNSKKLINRWRLKELDGAVDTIATKSNIPPESARPAPERKFRAFKMAIRKSMAYRCL